MVNGSTGVENMSGTEERYEGCRLCPRECGARRELGQRGICGAAGGGILVARAALHPWEEPCISGERGSGTVFFSGCPLRCVYCQNYEIAHEERGKRLSETELSDVFLSLQEKGAENINLVTPTHYTGEIISAVEKARRKGLVLPVVYNCSGYEKVETLQRLGGIVDIYLTDFKYMERELARACSHAPDYPETAQAALAEMVRQQKQPVFDGAGRMKRGVIVRHLLLPGHVKNAEKVVRYVYETYGNCVYLSLMNQYTPIRHIEVLPELNRKVTRREYRKLIDYAMELGVECGFIQEGETAQESFIPAFDGEGLEREEK